MNYLDDNLSYDKQKVIKGVVDIDEQIQEECNKEVVDKSKLTQLRFEQMLRGLYLWENPMI